MQQTPKRNAMKTQTPQVIVTESPPRVQACGSFGGGYSKPSTKDELVRDTASALAYEGFGRREVKLIAPEWVRAELEKQGFTFPSQ